MAMIAFRFDAIIIMRLICNYCNNGVRYDQMAQTNDTEARERGKADQTFIMIDNW